MLPGRPKDMNTRLCTCMSVERSISATIIVIVGFTYLLLSISRTPAYRLKEFRRFLLWLKADDSVHKANAVSFGAAQKHTAP